MKKRKAVTLIEILVTAGLTSVITILIVSSLLNALQSSDFNYKRFSAVANLNTIVNDIAQYSLLSNATPETLSYAGSQYTNDSDTLILKIPSIDSAGHIIVGHFDNIIYDFNLPNMDLKELIVPDAQSSRSSKDKIVTSNLAAVNFSQTNTANGLMENINFTINATSFNKTTTFALSRKIRMRNQE